MRELDSEKQLTLLWPPEQTGVESAALTGLTNPSAYSGFYGFHKYWGKKPVEPLRFLISALTNPNDLIVDPFLGSGAVAREAVQLGRRFIGGDVNPMAVRLTRFFLESCPANQYATTVAELALKLRPQIDSSYNVSPFGVASHLLWRGDELLSVWHRKRGTHTRQERVPTPTDVDLSLSFAPYVTTSLRPLRLFQNGRINSFSEISWRTLFSGRALRNIELLRDAICRLESPVRQALELTLTAAIGQMSKMVFAISSRGKTKGDVSERIEVGSWVIGYWRPETHFEINVWNCFEAKARRVQKALINECPSLHTPSSVASVLAETSLVSVDQIDALALVEDLPLSSTTLLITDPPHGDRIPYLELSEVWNAILDERPRYEEEIVISNAKGRGKTPEKYRASLDEFFGLAIDRLQNGAFLVLLFNSRRDDDWLAIRGITDNSQMNLLGCFPMKYSATSVVQDNREGGMKNDFILVYAKGDPEEQRASKLKSIPGWRSGWPE